MYASGISAVRRRRRACFEASSRLRLLRSFEPGGTAAEVPDPYYGGDEGFEAVLDMCERAALGIVEYLDGDRGGR